MQNIDINQAAQVVMEAEKAALNSLQTALNDFDAKLSEIEEGLPTGLPMDAQRIIAEVRSTLSYRRSNEVPMVLARYEPAPVAIPTNATFIPATPQG